MQEQAIAPDRARTESFLSALEAAVGESLVLADEATRRYYSNDVFWQPGIAPLAVVMAETPEQVARAVRTAAEHRIAVMPRGGGISYSKTYLPPTPAAIVIDVRKLDRVLEVNVADRYVTAEAGCTWAKVHEALKETGARTGYWGPLSGLNATVGGTVSQNSAFFGSGIHGTVGDSVIGVTVVLGNGDVVTTGSGGRLHARPFTRYAGPDLTGLFIGDTGAFGVKLAVTLSLVPAPRHEDFLGFGFPDLLSMARAQVEMSRVGAISESFGIDRAKALNSASVNKLADGLKILGGVARASKGVMQGLRDAVSVATTGASYLADHACSLHLVVEGRSAEDLAHNVAALREIGARHGIEIENAAPRVMRANPFLPLRGMLGADGQRWVPTHAVFPMSEAERVVNASQAFFDGKRELIERHGIVVSHLTMTVANEFFFEPALYWYDEITPLHRKTLGDEVVGPWLDRPANLPAREAAIELRKGMQQLYSTMGGVSWQIGRDYPFESILKPESWSLLSAVKRALDPGGVISPGSLGLPR